MAFWRIVGLFVAAAVVYGLVHDQITARLCLEYFTIGHPRVFASDSPTVHALYWGVAATWWAGLAVGLLVAAASRVGRLPKLTVRQQIKPALYLMTTMAVLAFSFGVSAYYDAKGHTGASFDQVFGGLPVPPEKQDAFMADFAAHNASYAVGFLGGIVVAGVSIVRRARVKQPPPLPVTAG